MPRAESDTTPFHAIACPTRRALLDALTDGEKNVSALLDNLEVTQSAVSQQLKVLKSAGLVEERQDGRFRYYRLRVQPLHEVSGWVERYRAHLERELDALGRVLDTIDDPPPRRPRSPR